MNTSKAYKAPVKDIQFLLWEQKRIQDTILPHYPHLSREKIDNMLLEAADFAENVLGANYQSADDQECWLDDYGKVHVPEGYDKLIEEFQGHWGQLVSQDESELPHIVHYAILEMFLGANPSFMPYIGFNSLATELIKTYGTEAQIPKFHDKLQHYQWASCFCTTESKAGSDLSRLAMTATKQDDGTYLIEGEKCFISAGMHDLTDNIVYFVLARTSDAPKGMGGLSCFIINRYLPDDDGNLNVRCDVVLKKMGLRGLSNTHLSFGKNGSCVGELLGSRENVGLTQLLSKMMTPARISTGIYANGMASSAYLNALEYAKERVQGKRFDLSMSATAPSLPIVEHPDVQRMLLSMKANTEGCRSLITTLGLLESEQYTKYVIGDETVPKGQVVPEKAVFEILSPIIKAYCSDQSWKTGETAIQVLGGNGYIREYPVEQYARDTKVLSIWEGTNHMQSQFLLRDKFGMGVSETKFMAAFDTYFKAAVNTFIDCQELHSESQSLLSTYSTFREALTKIGEKVRAGEIMAVPACSNIILEMIAEVTIGWQLLEAAHVAVNALKEDCSAEQQQFYQSKVKSAKFFVNTVLPLTMQKPATMDYLSDSLHKDNVFSAA